jgi:hypothetical protein
MLAVEDVERDRVEGGAAGDGSAAEQFHCLFGVARVLLGDDVTRPAAC